MSSTIRDVLRSDVLGSPPDWCATKWVLESPPFLFQEFDPIDFWRWKSELARRMEVDAKNVLITGSAAVGVSLNPAKHMKDFDSKSDIDVAVISTYHFDLAWRSLRGLGAERFKLLPAQQYALNQHVRRYIYWGTIATDRILPLLPFGAEWLSALSHIGTIPPTEGRDVKARIYRDFASLRSYLNLTFRNLRDDIFETGVAESERITESM